MTDERKTNEAANTVESMMYTTQFEGLSQYKVPYTRELEGKCFEIVFDDHSVFTIVFSARDTALFSYNGTDFCKEACHVMKAEDEAYLVFVDQKNHVPRKGFLLVIDLENDLVTGTFMQQGKRADFPGLVSREIKFGAIREGDKPLPEERHAFTTDLIGKKIEWTYNPNFSIIHVYLTPTTYYWAVNDRMKEMMQAARAAEGRGNEPMVPIIEESAYVKIRDNLYVFTFIEEHQGSGTQGFFVINTDRLNDCGVFFGNNPQGEPEGYMITAFGHWVTERIPYEDMIDEQAK